MPLSFWGGIDLRSGTILDASHPLRGTCIKGHILVIPSGRGSCTGSAAILELLYNGTGPLALIFETADPILTLGVNVARKLLKFSIPVLAVGPDVFSRIEGYSHAEIDSTTMKLTEEATGNQSRYLMANLTEGLLELSNADKSMLDGSSGLAAKYAMELVVDFAKMQGARCLINISRAHVDACIYIGPGILAFAEVMTKMKAKFIVPTTLNAISVDQRKWRMLEVNNNIASQAEALASAYLSMGAQPSFTCAPYSLTAAPHRDEQIGWSESNAVIFANSILGARTQKYPDFLDVCIALTGRAPFYGCHTDEGRLPSMRIHVEKFDDSDEANWSLLGYAAGNITGHKIPLITGIEYCRPTIADLKNVCAAFGTTSSSSMLHIAGITPEATNTNLPLGLPPRTLTAEDFSRARVLLSTAKDPSVQLVSLGSPHFLLEEFQTLAALCQNRTKASDVDLIITTNRHVYRQAALHGYTSALEVFGATILTDTCWCMVEEPVVRRSVTNIMTNSAKYAHYGPSLVKKGMHFGNLSECVDAACTGRSN